MKKVYHSKRNSSDGIIAKFMTSVLVLGDATSALEVVRSLGRCGYRMVVGTSSLGCYANLSRYCAETWYHPAIRDSAADFFESLISFLRTRKDIAVIFPTEDMFLVELSENWDKIPSHVKTVMPSRHNTLLCDDKLAMHELVAKLKIPQANYAVAQGMRALPEKCEELGYPCVALSPDSRCNPLGRTSIIIKSKRQLEELLNDASDSDAKILLRTFVCGTRYNYYFVASEGTILDGVQMKITRTDRIDNTGVQVESWSCAPLPEITRYSEQLLAHMNFSGPGMTQFLVDNESGYTVFLEINPRLGANCALARHLGIDLIKIAFDLTCGLLQSSSYGQSEYPSNLRFMWLGGILRGIRRDRRNGEISFIQALKLSSAAFLASARADKHICWRFEDPLPALAGLFPDLLFSLRKRLKRNLKPSFSDRALKLGSR